ncbi:MAG: metalloregulator ArsR/SmtB family transcription factor [Actinomycetota bacterium]|nr:metalloregulator ArsR/SmtB family transcription factor [Actinomycetota bacterium]
MPVAVETRLDALARVGRALADPTRCRLLMALLDGPAHPSELAVRLGLGRANTSNHLSCLRGCGLVFGEPEGRHVRYHLADANLAHALRDLADVVLAVDVDQPCLNDNDNARRTVATAEPHC